jgi:hypothetical protein
MFVAIDTGKNSVVSRVGMAINTVVPFPLMIPGINREKLGIVYREGSRFPSGSGCMAFHASRGETGRNMARVAAVVIIRLMTGEAIG